MEDKYIIKVKLDAGPFEVDNTVANIITADDIRKAEVKPSAMEVLASIAGAFAGPEKGTVAEDSVESDLRNIAQGLECYYLDNNEYPDALEKLLDAPGSCLPFIPEDRYGPEGDRKLRYATDGKNKWALQSRGPDGDFDADLQEFIDSSMGKEFFKGANPGEKHVYDPTKRGKDSGGDIIRAGP